jgi:hypothetical protein
MTRTKRPAYAWQLLQVFVEVAIALMVLTVGSGTFENVVLGVLVAIYAQMRLLAFGLDAKFAEAERANQARLVLLAKTLRTSNEIIDEDLRSAVEIYKEGTRIDWIPLVGFLVIFFAAVFRVVTAAVF